jgi:hypothetical protein
VTRPPTAAQRRVIDAADPVTGRLRGTESQLAALVKRGLAFRHPRPPHDHFLTPAGHRIREAAHAEADPAGASAAPGALAAEPPAATGVFAARVGGEESEVDSGPSRIREVHSAWQGLLELRRMTNPHGAVDRPCGGGPGRGGHRGLQGARDATAGGRRRARAGRRGTAGLCGHAGGGGMAGRGVHGAPDSRALSAGFAATEVIRACQAWGDTATDTAIEQGKP